MNTRKIVHKVTRQYMKLNPRRTAVTFTGIVFMVMLMTCVFAGKSTVINYMEQIAALDKGTWELMSYGLTKEETDRIEATGKIRTMARTAAKGWSEFDKSANEERPYIFIKGYEPEAFGMVKMEAIEGRLPENDSEIVLSKSVLDDGSTVTIGDKITAAYFDRYYTCKQKGRSATFPFFRIELRYGENTEVPEDFGLLSENDQFCEVKEFTGEEKEYTVVGFIGIPYYESLGAAAYPAFTILSGEYDTCNAIMQLDHKTAGPAYTVEHEISDIAGRIIKSDSNEMLLAFSAKGSDSVINSIVIFLEAFFVILIMAASIVLIYNVFNMSFAERTRYLGMLSSVGATRRQKRASVYYEALSLLIPAIPLGILLGMGVVKGAMLLLKPQLDLVLGALAISPGKNIGAHLCFSVTDILLVAFFCFVTVMLSALIPAAKAARTAPIESIRSSGRANRKHFRTKFSLMKKNRAEALLAVTGTTRCRYLTKGIVRSIAAFAILVMVTGYGASAVNAMVSTKLDDSAAITPVCDDMDYVLWAFDQGDSFAAYEQARELIERDRSVTKHKEYLTGFGGTVCLDQSLVTSEYMNAYEEILRAYITDETEVQKYLEHKDRMGMWSGCVVLDDEDYTHIAEKAGLKTDLSVPSVMICNTSVLTTDNMIFGEGSAEHKYIRVERSLNVEPGKDIELCINPSEENYLSVTERCDGAVSCEDTEDVVKINESSPQIIFNRAGGEYYFNTKREAQDSTGLDCNLYFSLDENNDGRLLSQLRSLAADNEHIEIMSTDMVQGITIKQAIVKIVNILSVCFIVLVSMVCLLNIYNSVNGRAVERSRETAVLRSVGMTQKQLDKMHSIENGIIITRGLAIAAVLSAAFIIFFGKFLTARFGNIPLPMPWMLCIAVIAAVTAAAAILTKLCYRSRNDNIVDMVRSENA
ncbi:MAG: ABC transporter permease [Ruminococcus sp.]|nr:ABC transporter permease [Ruminococcus sp.]